MENNENMNSQVTLVFDQKAKDEMATIVEEGGGAGGSSVTANPTLAGDEAALTGLEVDGTKYKVASEISVATNDTLGGIKTNGNNGTGMSLGVELDENNKAYVNTNSMNIGGATLGIEGRNINIGTVDHNTIGRSTITIGESFNGFYTSTIFYGNVNLTDANVNLNLKAEKGGYLSVEGNGNSVINGMALSPVSYANGGAAIQQLLFAVYQALESSDTCHLKTANPQTVYLIRSLLQIYENSGIIIGFAFSLDQASTSWLFLLPYGGAGWLNNLSSSIAFHTQIIMTDLGTDVIVSIVFTITEDGVVYVDAEKNSGYVDLGGKPISQIEAEIQSAFESVPFSDYMNMVVDGEYTVGDYSWHCSSIESNVYDFTGSAEGANWLVNVWLDFDSQNVSNVDVSLD